MFSLELSKSNLWLKIYDAFADWVDFTHGWSCIENGLWASSVLNG